LGWAFHLLTYFQAISYSQLHMCYKLWQLLEYDKMLISFYVWLENTGDIYSRRTPNTCNHPNKWLLVLPASQRNSGKESI